MNSLNVSEWLNANPKEAHSIINQFIVHHSHSLLPFSPLLIPHPLPLDYLNKVSTHSQNENAGIIDKIIQLALHTIAAERCTLLFLDSQTQELYSTSFDLLLKENSPKSSFHSLVSNEAHRVLTNPFRIPLHHSLFAPCVLEKKTIFINDIQTDQMLASLLQLENQFISSHLIARPILNPTDSINPVLGVALFINKQSAAGTIPFSHLDEKLSTELLQLIGVCVYSSVLYETFKTRERHVTTLATSNAEKLLTMSKEASKKTIMLDLASDLFAEDNIQLLGRKIMAHARELVNADKASLFLLTQDQKELVSTVFDTDTAKQFKLTTSKGIAGFVAKSGTLVNLKDVYQDDRFDPDMDMETGYLTKSMLSVPIPGRDRIVGVSSLINKLDSHGNVSFFTKEDEELFQTFSVICGLALQKSLLMEEIKKKQYQLEINTEMMSYHARVHPDDVKLFLSTLPKPIFTLEQLRDFNFDAHSLQNHDDQLIVIVLQMFQDLGYCEQYKITQEQCIQYFLTLRKNYRKVAYHNFTHAVSVTHSIYLLHHHTSLPHHFSRNDLFSTFLAALNHDIDHRGTNNAFQKQADTALSHYYSTSTMEKHHFNHALNILRQPGHHMFHSLSNTEYKSCLDALEYTILATDLSLFFKNKSRVALLCERGEFHWGSEECKMLGWGVVMTCCDLTAMTKPFHTSRTTADAVYMEFFSQGDEEVKIGLDMSSPLMDRRNTFKIPRMQDSFFEGIVVPAFVLLKDILVETRGLYDAVEANHVQWKEMALSDVPYVIEACV